MNKKIFVTIILLLLLAGCGELQYQIADPNSTVNAIVKNVEEVAIVAIDAAPVLGSHGLMLGALVSAITVAIGVYKNYRKNVTIGEEKDKYSTIEEATRAIVEAIDDISSMKIGTHPENTVGGVVKSRIADKLKDAGIYSVGKAVISGLKNN